MLYTEIYSSVLDNGFWSEWFPLSRSCRQGCPVSPSLFNLVIEVLGDKLHDNVKIKGVKINGIEIKGAQYADDIWLVLQYNRDNINEALSEFERFYQFSGLRINLHKSVILPIGNLTDTQPIFDTMRLQWTNDAIKVLDIFIHPDMQIMLDINYSPLLQKKNERLSPCGDIELYR